MSGAVLRIASPVFTADERALLTAAGAWIAASNRCAVAVAIETLEAWGRSAGLGQYAVFMVAGLDAHPSEDEPLMTIQQTREPGRRYVRLNADGHEEAAGNDLAALLMFKQRPTRAKTRRRKLVMLVALDR